jgi:zinc transport system substrate-binding protein
MKKSIFLSVLTVILLAFTSPSFAQGTKPRVVVSIAPIYSLVAGVMQGVTQPDLLVEGGGSPHGYMLRPSEARMLAKADLIIWVGPALEGFMEKSLQNLAKKAHKLQLMEALEGHLLPMREGGSWEAHADHEINEDSSDVGEEDHHHHETHGHDLHEGGEFNPHLWLSPLLAKQIVSETVRHLVEIDPEHAAVYQQNETRLHARLDALYRELSVKLAPYKDIPYIVFHDAYPYFEAAYGLSPVGSITVDPERKPGAKRISEIRKKIKELNARCVFSEPQFEPRMVDIIIEGTGARKGILDPLGAELVADEDSYFKLLNNLVGNLIDGVR